MTTDIKNRNEELKRKAPRLAALLQSENPFRIPEGYFEDNLKNLPILTSETFDKDITDSKKSFNLPESYFKNLDNRILSRIKELEKSGGGGIPEDYFETLPAMIINKIHKEEKADNSNRNVGRIRTIRSRIVKVMAAAAVLTGLVLSYGILTQQSSEDDVLAGLNSVSTSDLESYLSNQLDHLDEDELNTVIDLNADIIPDDEKEWINEDELEKFILDDMDNATIEDLL